ncbi:MAG UNVERIFIED_CONTAM: hypothetical protein LVR18_50270 [Planctomycetaceae bacterium]
MCDRTGVEVFGSGGLCYVPLPVNVNSQNRRLHLEARGGTALVHVAGRFMSCVRRGSGVNSDE